jgi:hypothetical protein
MQIFFGANIYLELVILSLNLPCGFAVVETYLLVPSMSDFDPFSFLSYFFTYISS